MPRRGNRYNGKGTETARRMLRKARRMLGKKMRDDVSVTEFCGVFNYSEDDFRKYVRTPILYFIVVLAMIDLFRDDMDLYFRCYLAILALCIQFPSVKRFFLRLRRFLMTLKW
jgi:hypothetical protein